MSQNWFLTESTNNDDRWCFEIATSKNAKFFFTYEEYFKELQNLITSLKQGDEIFMVGWVFALDIPLVPQSITCIQLLRKAYATGVLIKFLCNGTAPDSPISRNLINTIPNSIKPDKGAIVTKPIGLGDKNIQSDHHQKAVYIKKGDDDILFLGGMDITNDAGSNPKTNRRWFDIQVKIEGQGAILAKKTMDERWASVFDNAHITAKSNSPSINLKSKVGGNFKLQFVRSYPIAKSNQKFALNGDYTYYSLLRNAIELSNKSIYFEDQFFEPMGNNGIEPPVKAKIPSDIKRSDLPSNPKTIDTLLTEAIKSRKISVLGIGSDFKYPNGEENPNIKKIEKNHDSKVAGVLNQIIIQSNPLNSKHTGIRLLGELYKRPKKSYMHSKIWIFDDEFIIVGSANYWLFSFLPQSTDTINLRSEFGVGILPDPSQKDEIFGFPNVPFVKALRLKLWERLRAEVVPGYKFPVNKISDFDSEFEEINQEIVQTKGKVKIFVSPS